MTEATRKVEGGKLVRVQVEDGVRVLGDFFMHPEEEIEALERVVEEDIDADAEGLTEAVEGFLSEEDIELLGVERDIAETAVEARDAEGGEL